MAQIEVLNTTAHRSLKVDARRASALGDNVSSCWVYAFEMHLVQTCYPVFFQKAPNASHFLPTALFGFEPQQNLFLSSRGWEADYIPMLLQREPFSMGTSADSNELVIHIDVQSPRVSTSQGEPIFEPHGGHSPYLQNVIEALGSIHRGEQQHRGFSELLTEYDLLEPVFIDIPLSSEPNAETKRINGFYAVSEEKLNGLPAQALKTLQQMGLLKMLYFIVASQQQMPRLIARYHQYLAVKNSR